MKLKIVGGLRPPAEPTCDQLVIEIAKLVMRAIEPDIYAEHAAEGDGAFDFMLGTGYYAMRKDQIDFISNVPVAPKVKACKRAYLSAFSASSNYEYMTILAVLMKLCNTKIAPGIRVQMELPEGEDNVTVSLYYIEHDPNTVIFNTHAQLKVILDVLQRLDLSEVKLEIEGFL